MRRVLVFISANTFMPCGGLSPRLFKNHLYSYEKKNRKQNGQHSYNVHIQIHKILLNSTHTSRNKKKKKSNLWTMLVIFTLKICLSFPSQFVGQVWIYFFSRCLPYSRLLKRFRILLKPFVLNLREKCITREYPGGIIIHLLII